jgi:hypothetical protein
MTRTMTMTIKIKIARSTFEFDCRYLSDDDVLHIFVDDGERMALGVDIQATNGVVLAFWE